MSYPIGGVVIARDPFGAGSDRPYVIISNDTHPFHGEEYVVTIVTTTERGRAVPLTDETFTKGSLPRQSYASPWNPVTLKDDQIEKHVATIAGNTVDEVVSELMTYIGTDRDPTN